MRALLLTILVTFDCMRHCPAKIMRNQALLSQMVTNFHNGHVGVMERPHPTVSDVILPPQPPPEYPEPTQMNSHVVSVMQSVLCRNFPSVPCDFITHDKTLQKLIMNSIEQIMKKTSEAPRASQPKVEQPVYSHDRKPHVAVYRKVGIGNDYTKNQYRNRDMVLPGSHDSEGFVKLYPARNKKVLALNINHRNSSGLSTWRKDIGAIEDRLSNSEEEASELLSNGLHDDINPSIWHLDYYKAGSDKYNFAVNNQNSLVNHGPLIFGDENDIDT